MMSAHDYLWLLKHLNTRDMYMLGTGFAVGVIGTLSRIAFAIPRILKEIF